VAKRVILKNGENYEAKVILSNADPFTTRDLVGRNSFEKSFNLDLDSKIRLGTTMKVNLALNKLPTFKCHPDNKNQHNETIHILPQTENPI
jgi:phytoene dehydrogenase-like protein